MKLINTIIRIVNEEVYSPASDEYTPKKFITHVSNPFFRNDIKLTGLQTSVGECYQLYVNKDQTLNDKIKCRPAIFATDSLDKEFIFDSTYDDDIWIIDTECAGVTWYKDRHYGGYYKHHIVTFDNIPLNCIKLIYKGTGESY